MTILARRRLVVDSKVLLAADSHVLPACLKGLSRADAVLRLLPAGTGGRLLPLSWAFWLSERGGGQEFALSHQPGDSVAAWGHADVGVVTRRGRGGSLAPPLVGAGTVETTGAFAGGSWGGAPRGLWERGRSWGGAHAESRALGCSGSCLSPTLAGRSRPSVNRATWTSPALSLLLLGSCAS